MQRRKLMLDLFEKRYRVFQAAFEFVLQVVLKADIDGTDLRAFDTGSFGRSFLFGADVTRYLDELRTTAVGLMAGNKRYNHLVATGVSPEEQEAFRQLNEKNARDLEWLTDQFPAGIESVFAPYLSFSAIKDRGTGRGQS